ncbi:cell division protein FtsJ [Paenibacillus sp. N1-5-1-14]|uniref:cyclic-phosphate processing receiver domain-containing protein n=1 Tax=Paenibacillus radicibacter TaxID=2972488 RepID=UPI0021596995|nr:cyclic-phosphate processing receiver domain-containing protein [Paenibacillus radicibacter]MCR8641585.1 cell division protein FtsJ [Paenibacillus radicibacter]
MIHVYLDDARRCPQGFVLARNVTECILLLDSSEVDILSLDYDLGWDQPSGGEVARWIVSAGKFPREIYLHTSSNIGRIKMYEMLYAAKPEGVKVHNGPMPDELIVQIAQKDT